VSYGRFQAARIRAHSKGGRLFRLETVSPATPRQMPGASSSAELDAHAIEGMLPYSLTDRMNGFRRGHDRALGIRSIKPGLSAICPPRMNVVLTLCARCRGEDRLLPPRYPDDVAAASTYRLRLSSRGGRFGEARLALTSRRAWSMIRAIQFKQAGCGQVPAAEQDGTGDRCWLEPCASDRLDL